MDRHIERAIILAAGTGSRLVGEDSFPKPLTRVARVSLLVRVLRTLQGEGVREAVIVIGYRGEQIRRALLSESLGLELHFVDNQRFNRKNGVSLLAARAYVDRECILSMADHLYPSEAVRRLSTLDLPSGACALGVDFDVERCFDLENATKVRVSNGKIEDIAKDISEYDGIVTGVSRIGPELIGELARLERAGGDCSLSDGVRALASRGRVHACDIGYCRWIDVDSPEALVRAEAMLRVFGDSLGDEPAATGGFDGDAMERFAPTWVRTAQPYRDHFQVASSRRGVVRMMSNESPFPPSERVIEAIVAAARGANLYPVSGAEVRCRLALREGLEQAHIVLGAGSTELIDLVIRTFVAPAEEVLLSVPTFSMYEARACVCGGVPICVPMTHDHEFDVAGIVSAVTERTKVIFLCTPNNPSGNRLSEASMRRILRLGLPTGIDEAYHELGETPGSLSHLLAEFPNAVLIRTFSKAFGLAGLRLGYAIAHPTVIRLLLRAKLPWNISCLTLAAALAALDDVEEFERRMTRLRNGRDYLEKELGKLRGLSVTAGDGNFVLLDVTNAGATAEEMVDAMLEDGVYIRSLAVHQAGRNYVRVSVGTEEQNERCVEVMQGVLAKLGRLAPAVERRWNG